MNTHENIRNGFWFSFGFGMAILMLTTGCFYLTEVGLGLLVPKQEKGETQMEDEKMTERCKEFETPQTVRPTTRKNLSSEPSQEPEATLRTERLKEALAVVERSIALGVAEGEGAVQPTLLYSQLPTLRDVLNVVIGRKDVVGNADFKEDCFLLREQITETKMQTMLVLKTHPVFGIGADGYQLPPGVNRPTITGEQADEMKANLILSFRHLEDARMRLGKAIQAFDGGKSVYPR